MTRIIKTYSELIKLPTFKERFDYASDGNSFSTLTFANDRYLNQRLYLSKEWRKVRDYVIIRDGCCDLAHPDHPVESRGVVHHLIPLILDDFDTHSPYLLDPEFLVYVGEMTHKAIHIGDFELVPKGYVERRPYDTCPWKL